MTPERLRIEESTWLRRFLLLVQVVTAIEPIKNVNGERAGEKTQVMTPIEPIKNVNGESAGEKKKINETPKATNQVCFLSCAFAELCESMRNVGMYE